MNIKINRLAFPFLLAILISCNNKKTEQKPDYNRSDMLQNVSANIIIPAYEELKIKSDSLVIYADVFVSATSDKSLLDLQNQWKITSLAFKKCELFKFGPAENLEQNIDYWSTNPALIESEIAGSAGLDSAYIANTGSTRKGLPALEYLLFTKSNISTILSGFTSQSNSNRRKSYLQLLARDIRSNAANVESQWKNGYSTQFNSSTGTDIGSSTSILLNQMASHLEVIIKKKMGNALGKKNSQDQTINVDSTKVEGYLSDMSSEYILTNLNTYDAVFTGNTGAGFDDYLAKVDLKSEDGTPLHQKISGQITKLREKITAIPLPMSTSIQSNSQPVVDAWTEARRLLVLIKTDMMSGLGIQVNFSDSDGD